MRRTIVLMVAAGAVTAMTVVAPAANAAGRAEQGPQHSNSICSYSGLNDDLEEDPNRVQSYGQIVRAGGKAFAPSPSEECNAHILPWQDVTGSH